MRLLRINHLGIASPSLSGAMQNLERIFGIQAEHVEEVPDQKVRTAFYPMGESTLEYLESTDPEGPIAKFLEKRGPGIHHVAFEVDDVDAAVKELLAKGVRMVDQVPRQGAHGNRIAFIHPSETGGVLVEICKHMGE